MNRDLQHEELESRVQGMFEIERRTLGLPDSVRSSVSASLSSTPPIQANITPKPPLLAALAFAAVAIIGATTAILLMDRGGSPQVEPVTVNDFGRPVTQVGSEPLVQERGNLLIVQSHTAERGPAALDAAREIIPFELDLPTHIPQNLRASHVSAGVDVEEPELANLSVAYTLEPNGSPWRPELSLSWIGNNPDPGYPLRDHEAGQTFDSGGHQWRTFLYEWRDGDSWEAVTTREDGVQVFVSLRVAGGLDHDETLAELKKVVESMQPARAE